MWKPANTKSKFSFVLEGVQRLQSLYKSRILRQSLVQKQLVMKESKIFFKLKEDKEKDAMEDGQV